MPYRAMTERHSLPNNTTKYGLCRTKRRLATYLNPGLFKPRTYAKRQLIYPFGSNTSQLKAVQKAFEHSISVIQGPPGTGKTQTILNIIANILVAGKTVLVVSNNNSATDNVLEKLIKYEFGFLAAPLGNSDNKQRFIESQEKEKQYPKVLASWRLDEANRPEFLEQIDRQIELLHRLFAKQERLAIAKQELQALETERRHFEREIGASDYKITLRKTGNIPRLTRLWFDLQQFAEDAALRSGFFGNMRVKFRWIAIRLRSQQLLKGYRVVSSSATYLLSYQTCKQLFTMHASKHCAPKLRNWKHILHRRMQRNRRSIFPNGRCSF